MSRAFRTVVDGLHFTEGPRWHEGRFWFVDFYSLGVYSAAEDGSDLLVEARVPHSPSGLGWLPDGRLLVVSRHDRRVLRREPDGTLVTHADLSAHTATGLNDMVVDATGRAWVGNFGFDLMGGGAVTPTTLHRVDPDGTVTTAAEDLWFPNGSVVTTGPDGRSTLLVDETFGNRVTAFAIAEDGTLTDRRTWARFGDLPTSSDLGTVIDGLAVAPDGNALDAEGCLWIADATGQRVLRVRGGGTTGEGEVVDEISPGTGVFACGLGGADGTTLFLCTAPDFGEDTRRAAREATIVATRVEVPADGW